MNALSRMSAPTSSPDMFSAISLRELASGAMLCVWPDGRTTERYGREVARASLSPRLAKALGLTTSGISGLRSSISSSSAILQSSLESRLRAKTASLGSTLYQLTWKERAGPSQLPICALRASARRTSDSEASGWQLAGWTTATSRDWKDSGADIRPRADGSLRHDQLPRQANLAGWPTATGSDTTGARPSDPKRGPTPGLVATSALAGWGTPTATNRERDEETLAKCAAFRLRNANQKTVPLYMGEEAQLAGWPTCQARDGDPGGRGSTPQTALARFASGRRNLDDATQLALVITGPHRLTVSGQMLTGSDAGMESGGQLNPAHSRWLMGLPIEWDDCAAMVTRLSVRSRRASSKV